jgi:hypothetical protein
MRRIALPAGMAPLALVATLALVPRAALNALPEVCIFRRLLGVECWGCGMTRAVWHLLRGDWDSAVAYHPWAPAALIAGCLISTVVWIAWLVRAGRLPVSELRQAGLGLWLSLAAATLPATVGVGASATAHLAPALRYPHSRACPLCGLTRSFTEAARGRLGAAGAASSGGAALYLCLLGNQVAALVWVAGFRRRHGRRAGGGVACKCSA